MDKFIYALNGDQNDSWVQYAFLFALSEMNYANTNIFDEYKFDEKSNKNNVVKKSEKAIYSWYENGNQYNKNEFKPMENKGEELDILYRIITNIENFDITGTQSITGKYSCAMSLIFAFANSQNG